MKNILVVDDAEENRMLCREVLTHLGYGVIEARDGAEAVRLAKERLPSLVLMDICMPGMDGREAASALRADPVTREIKIIALSAISDALEVCEFLETDFDGHLAKPIDLRLLRELITRCAGAAEGDVAEGEPGIYDGEEREAGG